MSRTLTALNRSTPTYVFKVTDAEAGGVNLEDMKIMMCIHFVALYNEAETVFKRYVIGESPDTSKYTYKYDPEADLLDLTQEVWFDSTYCKNHGGGTFSVTVPLWMFGLDIISATYQVFLYGDVAELGVSVSSTPDGENHITPGRIAHHNIMIDDGSIEITPSYFPLSVAAWASRVMQYTGLTMENLETIKNIDFSNIRPYEHALLTQLLRLPEADRTVFKKEEPERVPAELPAELLFVRFLALDWALEGPTRFCGCRRSKCRFPSHP